MWIVSSVAMASSASQDQDMACGASGRALNSSGSSGRAYSSVSLCAVCYENVVNVLSLVRQNEMSYFTIKNFSTAIMSSSRRRHL